MFSTLSFDSSLAKSGEEQSSCAVQLPRSRRQQVARACSNCRAYRIKCDNEQPCRNCRRRGKKCDHESSIEVRTFASAVREIERLNKRVQELEELLQANDSTGSSSPEPVIRSKPNGANFLPVNLDPLAEHGGNRNYWECISLETRVGTIQCYGPASIFYYIARMNMHMASATSEVATSTQAVAIAERLSLVSNTDFESNFMHMAGPINRIYMERAYEEFYLNIFWEEYHCLYPIIEEADFWNYHRSLWDKSQKFRKPSALVDIILAICLQHGTTSCRIEGRPSALADKSDEIIASRWFYRRCQSLLTNQLETPSIVTLQSHMLTVIYLSNANSQNAAHSALAVAIRTGIILGLHLEPPENLPDQQREARKRLWWLLYALEMKFAMDLGRPLAVNISQVTCSLPSDETLAYTTVQQKTIVSKEAAFLSFSVHFVRLMLAIRACYITFYDNCANVLGQNKQRTIYGNPRALDGCAVYLETRMQYAEKWLRDVPEALKAGKGDEWAKFITHHSTAPLDPTLPRWQQQQSLFLELHFHNMMMNLYRPFICFPPPPGSTVPPVDRCALSCLSHARSMTSLISQSLEDNKLLENHHEAFRWQWNAALVLVGYAIAYPTTPESASAIEMVHIATKVFDHLGECFAIALLAKQTTEELLARVSTLNQMAKPTTSMTTDVTVQPTSETLQIPASAAEAIPQIDPRFIADYDTISAANIMSTIIDGSDRFAWGQNLVNEDFFGMGSRMTVCAPSTPWAATTQAGEDDELFRLLNAVDYGADEANAILDALP